MPVRRTMLCCAAALCVILGACAPLKGRAGHAGLATLDFREVVNGAKERVFPAVVFVKCIRESHAEGKRSSEQVSGSGVIITPTGEVLTNWHVVDKAVQVRCLLLDGRGLDASVVGKDKDLDLALLQLAVPAGGGPLPCAALGESGVLKEGDFVMAMGAPWGLARSVSIGIVSCTARYLPGSSEYSLWLQSDASISPGNSGGPLVNTQGEVVAITTLAALIGGDLGFGVPSDTIRQVLPHLRREGHMNWSWTGLQLQPLRDFNRDIYFEGTEGLIVSGTDPESPARGAGVLPRDRVLSVNGIPTNALTEEDLPAIRMRLGMLPKGEAATVELLRDEKRISVAMTPREKGEVEGRELDCARWDFTVKAINQFDNPDLYYYRHKGVFVYGIKRPGNAADTQLRTGDILLQIDGEDADSLDDVRRIHAAALESLAAKHRVVLTVLRNGLMRQVVLDFARDYERE